MTVDEDELQKIMEAAERDQKTAETDGLLRVGKIKLPKELPTFDEEFYEWKRQYWAKRIEKDGIKNIVAPMVDQSELAFRMFMRCHNGHLFFTPMIHARLFVESYAYRKTAISSVPEDRPLIVQFCANDPDIFLDACRLVEGFCDGVDLNLGCPQMVARRGRYGSFLQEQPELIAKMVSKVHKHCRLPLSVKIRVLEDLQSTINYAKIIENAGASMLTVHGRIREQRGTNTGLANWDKIREVCNVIKIPVVANGNVQMPGDVERCMEETGAIAVMSAEGLLSNPVLFEGRIRPGYELAEEYLDLAEKYKADKSSIRAHCYRFCHYSMVDNPEMRTRFGHASTIDDFRNCLKDIRATFEEQAKDNGDGLKFLDGTETSLMEQVQKMPAYFAKPYVRPPKRQADEPLTEHRAKRRMEMEKIQAETGLSFKKIRKRQKRKLAAVRVKKEKHVYPACKRCNQPAGKDCEHDSCKKCCRGTCIHENKTCKAHKLTEAIIAPKYEKYLKHQAENAKAEGKPNSQEPDKDPMDKIEEPLDDKVAG